MCRDFGFPPEVQRWILGRRLADDDSLTLEQHKVTSEGCPVFLYLVAPDTQQSRGGTRTPSYEEENSNKKSSGGSLTAFSNSVRDSSKGMKSGQINMSDMNGSVRYLEVYDSEGNVQYKFYNPETRRYEFSTDLDESDLEEDEEEYEEADTGEDDDDDDTLEEEEQEDEMEEEENVNEILYQNVRPGQEVNMNNPNVTLAVQNGNVEESKINTMQLSSESQESRYSLPRPLTAHTSMHTPCQSNGDSLIITSKSSHKSQTVISNSTKQQEIRGGQVTTVPHNNVQGNKIQVINGQNHGENVLLPAQPALLSSSKNSVLTQCLKQEQSESIMAQESTQKLGKGENLQSQQQQHQSKHLQSHHQNKGKQKFSKQSQDKPQKQQMQLPKQQQHHFPETLHQQDRQSQKPNLSEQDTKQLVPPHSLKQPQQEHQPLRQQPKPVQPKTKNPPQHQQQQTASTEKHTATTTNVGDSLPTTSSPSSSSGWVCPTCTLVNKWTRPGCEACATERPGTDDHQTPESSQKVSGELYKITSFIQSMYLEQFLYIFFNCTAISKSAVVTSAKTWIICGTVL